MAGSGAVYDAISAIVGALPGVHEKRMVGGVCFMLEGNMVCGAMKGWAMVRVGKPNEARALALPGVEHAMPSGRKMTGFVRIHEGAMVEEETALPALLDMALGFVATLPAK